MYASFDLQAMRVAHVHPVHRVVSLLAYLELPDVPVRIKWLGTADALLEFTELELRTVLLNLGAGDTTAYHTKRALAALLFDKVRALPYADVVEAELLAQYAAVKANDTRVHKYAKGASTPAQPQQLFAGSPPASPLPAPPAVAPPVAQVQAPPAQPRAPAAPPAGSVTQRIYAACNDAWLAAGSPRDAAGLGAVRRTAIAALVAAGVNDNSAKKGTGLWLREQNSS